MVTQGERQRFQISPAALSTSSPRSLYANIYIYNTCTQAQSSHTLLLRCDIYSLSYDTRELYRTTKIMGHTH